MKPIEETHPSLKDLEIDIVFDDDYGDEPRPFTYSYLDIQKHTIDKAFLREIIDKYDPEHTGQITTKLLLRKLLGDEE